MTPNVFTTAKKLETKTPKATKKAETPVEIAGLEIYASIIAMQKALGSLKSLYEAQVHEQANAIQLETALRTMEKPKSIDIVEGIASASFQTRKRSSASQLTEIERQMLDDAGVEYAKDETTIPETFVINPAYLNDGKLLEKVGETLGKIKGMPEDFIMKQEGFSKTSYYVTDETLTQVFRKKDAETVERLMKITTTPAARTKISTENLNEAMNKVLGLVSEFIANEQE